MESSTVLAFRIFVMLSCLIIVPMAAIFGSAFPDVVKTVLVDRIVAFSTGKPVEGSKSDADPNGFRSVTAVPSAGGEAPAANAWQAPRWGTSEVRDAAWTADAANNAPAAILPVAGSGPRQGGNQPAAFSAPAENDRNAPRALQQGGGSPFQNASSERIVSSPATEGFAAPPNQPSQPGQPGGDPAFLSERTACPLEQPDRFTAMERKLRQHGATYYLLETWGNEGEQYRFHCRMAIGNNANYTRHFEATDRDALKAMSQVLERVEAWRAGRLP